MSSVVWILWLAAVMAFVLSTRNPIYLILILVGLFALGNRLARDKKITAWIKPNLRFLLMMVFLSTLINGLFSHVGSTILFSLPQGWPLIGGNITVESIVYGAINGLVIGALYTLFNIINLALSIKQITRLIPRAFHPVAMMVTIALTFFPSIQQRAREIKEAQMIRGNPMKKIADWIPILIPLLVTSLENAILLAESMTARGFHKQVDLRSPSALISLISGVFLVFGGWVLQLYRYPGTIFIPLYLLGGLLMIATLLHIGKQTKITRYHHEALKPADYFIVVIITSYLISFAFLAFDQRLTSLSYTPYPHLSFPAVQMSAVIFTLLPLLPLVFTHYDLH
jgi:energy-coupling factor transport system permease protein